MKFYNFDIFFLQILLHFWPVVCTRLPRGNRKQCLRVCFKIFSTTLNFILARKHSVMGQIFDFSIVSWRKLKLFKVFFSNSWRNHKYVIRFNLIYAVIVIVNTFFQLSAFYTNNDSSQFEILQVNIAIVNMIMLWQHNSGFEIKFLKLELLTKIE